MRIHGFEIETNADKAYEDVNGHSWAICGKRISNEAITTNPDQFTCATCTKIWARGETGVSENAA